MASMAQKPTWSGRIGALAKWGAVIAISAGFVLVTLARYDVIEKLAGFSGLLFSLVGLAVMGVLGLLAVVIGLIGKGPKKSGLVAFGIAAVVIGAIFVLVVRPGMSAPPLHDITTNVDNPPQFVTLELREDNLIPFKNQDEWKAAHRAGYPDIAPITLTRTPAETLALARELATARGWEIAAFDEASGHMEATAFAAYIRFRDDVIIDVTPTADGMGSVVNMRSVSRVGLGDLGYNAARVKEFLAALEAGA